MRGNPIIQYSLNFRLTIRSAFEENPGSLPAQVCYLDILATTEQWDTFIETLRYLDGISYANNVTALTVYLVQEGMIPSDAGQACRKSNEAQVMLDAAEAALNTLRIQGNEAMTIRYLCDLALFRHSWFDEDERPLELFEEASNRYQAADQGTRAGCQRFIQVYLDRYAQICFDMAVKNHKCKFFQSNSREGSNDTRWLRLALTNHT